MTALLNPTLLLAGLLAVAIGSLFHLWVGRTLRDLAVYLGAALIGVGLGQWIGQTMGLAVVQIGQLHLAEALIGAALALMIVKTFQV